VIGIQNFLAEDEMIAIQLSAWDIETVKEDVSGKRDVYSCAECGSQYVIKEEYVGGEQSTGRFVAYCVRCDVGEVFNSLDHLYDVLRRK